jgi:hypothetical protein
MAGTTRGEAWRAIATFGRRPLIDHSNSEEFADPVDYDREDSSDTGVAFYAAPARETGGPVLEIACGTGRVAIPIARQYGDWNGGRLTATSPSIVVVCRKHT